MSTENDEPTVPNAPLVVPEPDVPRRAVMPPPDSDGTKTFVVPPPVTPDPGLDRVETFAPPPPPPPPPDEATE